MKQLQKRDKSSLMDIIRACSFIEQFVSDTTESEFADDPKTFFAVQMQIIIVGEASTRLSETCRNKQDHIAWRSIIGMRNILIHRYDDLEAERIWRVAVNDIPKLKTQIQSILNDS